MPARVRSVPIGEIAAINPKGPVSGSLRRDDLLDFLPMSDLTEQGTMAVSAQRPYAEVAKGYTAFRDGDILLAKITPCFENNKIALAEVSTEWAFGSTEYHVIRPGKDADGRYLLHFLRQDSVRTAGEKRMTGSGGQRRVPKSFLEELTIPLPPLAEQKRIAAILDQADALRRLRRRALDRLNTLGQAIFQEMFGDPASNPKGFLTRNLSEIVRFIGGSQPPKSTFLYEDGPDRVRFVQTRDFRTDAFKTYIPKQLAKRPFQSDDVMIGRYGPPVFQIFRGLSGTYNVALMKAEPRDGVSKDFVFYLLQEPKLHGFVVANSERTAGQSGVNLALLEAYPAFLPPTDLQARFSAAISQVEGLRIAVDDSVQHQSMLFASLQHRAFRGGL